MAAFATAADMASLWRPLTADETPVAEALLDRASTLLRSRSPKLDERITAGALDADLAALAVVEMVKRVLRNPEGLRSSSESTGPFSSSDTWDIEAASGRLEVLTEDLELVEPAPARRVRSMRLNPGLR